MIWIATTMAYRAKACQEHHNDVPFCDSTVKAVTLVDDGVTKHYVGLRAMCDARGADDTAQRQRIERNAVLAIGLWVCMIQPLGSQQITMCSIALSFPSG